MLEDKSKKPEQPKAVDGGKHPEPGPAKMQEGGYKTNLSEATMPKADRAAEQKQRAADRMKGS